MKFLQFSKADDSLLESLLLLIKLRNIFAFFQESALGLSSASALLFALLFIVSVQVRMLLLDCKLQFLNFALEIAGHHDNELDKLGIVHDIPALCHLHSVEQMLGKDIKNCMSFDQNVCYVVQEQVQGQGALGELQERVRDVGQEPANGFFGFGDFLFVGAEGHEALASGDRELDGREHFVDVGYEEWNDNFTRVLGDESKAIDVFHLKKISVSKYMLFFLPLFTSSFSSKSPTLL